MKQLFLFGRVKNFSVLQIVQFDSTPGSTQTSIQFSAEAVFQGVKWPECEADYSLPASTEVKNEWSYKPTQGYRCKVCTVITLPYLFSIS